MKAVVLVLAVIAAVMVFTLPGKDTKINKRIAQCTRSLSTQNNPMMSKIDKVAFCGCVARSVDDDKPSKSDATAMKPCIDQYIQAPAKQMCEVMGTQTKSNHYNCNCFYDKLSAVIMNHADATRNHRTITLVEAQAEQKQFEQCSVRK